MHCHQKPPGECDGGGLPGYAPLSCLSLELSPRTMDSSEATLSSILPSSLLIANE